EADAALLRSQGFQELRLLSADSDFAGVRLLKTTSGPHGSDRTYAVPAMADRRGEACGGGFRPPQETTRGRVGDPLWREDR
ncbi:MBL fold metallo-hydrolase, partial [Klebsiella pneumoniae]|nr:MBL fold metallo-hydrolase [Klebsiella pneumoniae]